MNEIIDIITRCHEQRRLLSSDEVKRICYIILKKNNYDTIKNIEMKKRYDYDERCGGRVYLDTIYFYLDGIKKTISDNGDDLREMYGIDGSKIDVYNFFYLTIIFHELAHVRQYSVADSPYYSVEKKLFSFFFDVSKDRKFYNENYNNILTEVNAINSSLINSYYCYCKLPLNYCTKNDRLIYQLAALKHILYRSYEVVPKTEEIISPAERISYEFDDSMLKRANMDIEKYANLIYDREDFTLYKKLMLGLPLSYPEYAYINLLISELGVNENVNSFKKLQKIIK